MTELKIALITAELTSGAVEGNLARLLKLNRSAAGHGAKIIVNTEMGLSGYSFPSREGISGCVLPKDSKAVQSFARLAAELEVWICLGFAEVDAGTGIFYNSAVIFDSQGHEAALHRKVTAEPRWACPGPSQQQDVCETPWGRVGLLICSETYFSLLPRVQALKGVDLLLCPANWPRAGLDPVELWRARACENGVYLAACNRSGKEETICFDDAPCCLAGPWGGEAPLDEVEPEILTAEIPLQNGKLETRRTEILSSRKPEAYYPICAALRQAQADMGAYYRLPEPGGIQVHCLTGLGCDSIDGVGQTMGKCKTSGRDLFVLPAVPEKRISAEQLSGLSQEHGVGIFTAMHGLGGDNDLLLCTPGDGAKPLRFSNNETCRTYDWGPARLGLCYANDLEHPELAAALAKLGCDLALGSGGRPWDGPVEGLAVKCLDKVGLALALPNLGLICQPPEGHARWRESSSTNGRPCSLNFNTKDLRQKFFLDFVDYERLFERRPT